MLIGLNQRLQMCQMKMTSNGGRPKMEDDLKILKVKYLSNHWSDRTQILKLKIIGPNKRIQRCQMKMTSNGR